MDAPKNEHLAIQCCGITKRFGSVLANDCIELDLQYGEILALLGENGSGKTTLMNMISGIYHPDEGTIFLDGKQVFINSPIDAIRLGIGMIHQHFKLVDVMTAFENTLLGTQVPKGEKLKDLRKKAEDLCEKYHLDVSLDKKIYDMSVSEKQVVEVLKVLYRGARILILDEPTAVLTPQEIERLFDILRAMKAEGCAVIIITHKLNEVMNISNRVAVLRKGKSIDTVQTKDMDEKKLTEIMVGRPISLAISRPKVKDKKVALKVENLFAKKSDGTKGIVDVSFEMMSGEILGIAGIAGSGQKELTETIVGLCKADSGSIHFEGEEILSKDVTEIFESGISLAFVPEDRLGMGLVGSMGMVGNMMLKKYKNHKGIFVDRKPSRQQAEGLKEKLNIQTPNVDTPVRMLSGGNVQKVLIGREIESNPKVLLTAYPVRGLDINSSYTIYDLLNDQKQKGCAVMFVGEDLDVLLELADRIMVLCHGEVMGILDGEAATKEQIGLMMVGIKEGEESA